jgi:hypothetical protein
MVSRKNIHFSVYNTGIKRIQVTTVKITAVSNSGPTINLLTFKILKGLNMPMFVLDCNVAWTLALKMEAVCSSEILKTQKANMDK